MRTAKVYPSKTPCLSFSYRVFWWGCFLFATYALSRVFQASRALTASLPEASWPEFSLWFVLLFLAFLFLALMSYRKERAKGAVLKTKAIMEFLDRWIPFGKIESALCESPPQKQGRTS